LHINSAQFIHENKKKIEAKEGDEKEWSGKWEKVAKVLRKFFFPQDADADRKDEDEQGRQKKGTFRSGQRLI